MKPPRDNAFTLLEILVVIGLIAGLSFWLIGVLGGGRAMSLSTGQTLLANLITAARTKAPATSHKTRLLINADPSQPDRYLRLLVLQVARQPGASPTDWDTSLSAQLPEGVYVVPPSLAGIVANPADWKRVSDPSADLASDVFENQALIYQMNGDPSEQPWFGVAFTPNSTLSALLSGPPPKGTVVLAQGRIRTPGSYGEGQPPVELFNPQNVRGIMLSAYGIPALLPDRSAF